MMKNKTNKFYFLVLIFFILNCKASELPKPDGGIKIIARNEMIHNRFNYNVDPEFKLLQSIQLIALNPINLLANNSDFMSTHLRKSADEMKIAYDFNGIPINKINEIIGVVPYLTYIKDKGWTGVRQFFISNSLNNCYYQENYIILTHASVILAKEAVTYSVNNKVTLYHTVGENNSGFTYTIDWFDDQYFRTIKCSSNKLDKNIKTELIELAKDIVKYNDENKK